MRLRMIYLVYCTSDPAAAAGDGRAENVQATFEHPEIVRFRAENPLSAFTTQPVSIDVADVVKTAVLAPVR